MVENTTTEEIVDVEGEEVEAPIVRHQEPVAAQPPPAPSGGGALALFGTTDPVKVVEKASEVASALMAPVISNELYIQRQEGKGKYLNVEAWTLLASMLQVRAIPGPTEKEPNHLGEWHPPKTHTEVKREHSKWCKQGPRDREGKTNHNYQEGCDVYEKKVTVIDEPGAGGFTCRVEAIDAAGNVIGASSSRCMWEEARWAEADAYALESMAQTRGISKALSGPLRFIVELAGFKGTPAEEVPEDASEWDRGRPAGDDDPARPKKAKSDFACPECGEKVWDNREENQRRRDAGEEVKTPAFRCDNPKCEGGSNGRPWATWSTSHFTDNTTKAKQLVYDATKANEEGWARQFQADDPAWDDRERELVTAAAEGSTKEKAGWLWSRLRTHSDLIGWAQGDDEEPDNHQVAGIARAAEIMLAAEEPMTEVDALEQAWEQVTDEALEASRGEYVESPYG